MLTRPLILLLAVLAISPAGCIDLSIPIAPTLFPTGTSFVVTGTAVLLDNDGPCLAWIGNNGVTYHLFQDARVANEDFDIVTTTGVTSRLLLASRADLIVTCQIGTIVEVQDVLEVVE